MRLYKYGDKLCVVIGVVVCLIIVSGCFQKKREENSTDNTKVVHAWTDTIIGTWYIRIHSPEPGEHPGIWEGPLEIGDKPGTFFCKSDASLIKGLRLGSSNDILIVETFSGSQTYDVQINIDSCKAVTR